MSAVMGCGPSWSALIEGTPIEVLERFTELGDQRWREVHAAGDEHQQALANLGRFAMLWMEDGSCVASMQQCREVVTAARAKFEMACARRDAHYTPEGLELVTDELVGGGAA